MLRQMDARARRSPLALAVLALLEVGPLHPYGIQRLLKEWGKDRVVNVGNPATLYKTMKRLEEAGLITVRHTERNHLYPERTVYELTDQGRQEVAVWLHDKLSTPRNEFPEFPAALSFAMLISPDDLLAALERRAAQLENDLQTINQVIDVHGRTLPRVTLLDDEYRRAMIETELKWVRRVADDLRAGSLTWSEEIEEAAKASLEE